MFSYAFCHGQRRTVANTVVLSCMHTVVDHRPSLDRELLTSVLALIHVVPSAALDSSANSPAAGLHAPAC